MKSVSSSAKHSNAHGFSMSGNLHFPFPEKKYHFYDKKRRTQLLLHCHAVRGYFFPRTFENYLWEELFSYFFSESSLLTHTQRAKPRVHTRPSLTPTSSFFVVYFVWCQALLPCQKNHNEISLYCYNPDQQMFHLLCSGVEIQSIF